MVLDINGETCFDCNKVANYFNEFYTTVASTLVSKLPTASNQFGTDSEKFKSYYEAKNVSANALKISPVTSEFVYKELTKLKSNKSTGPDGIPVKFLKDGAMVVGDHITFIINLSISSGTVPVDLKYAR